MSVRSHRLKVEEKKLLRKVLKSIIVVFLGGFLILYVGLPTLAKVILLFTRSDRVSTQNETADYLFPPTLETSFEATNTAKISLSGTGKAESTIKIFVNSEEQAKILTAKDGSYLAKNISLKEGDNSIFAVNILDNKESSPSDHVLIVYKKEPPKLDISSPKNEEKISGDSEDISIIGETDQDNRVTINDRTVIVESTGRFNFLVRLNSGENIFKIRALDNAGNETNQELKVYR